MSKETHMWQVLGNSAEKKGALAIVGHRGGKPFFFFSRETFAKEYPAQMDASLHPPSAIGVSAKPGATCKRPSTDRIMDGSADSMRDMSEG